MMSPANRRCLIALVLTVAGCSSGSPTSAPTPTMASGAAAIVATPAPAVAAPAVGAAGCPLGYGTYNAPCGRQGPRLLADVEGAIDRLVTSRPTLFDLTTEAAPGRYRVLDQSAVERGVIDNLVANGMCAQPNQGGIEVKSSNSFSETYKIVESSGFLWRGEDLYRKTCTPAAFPVNAAEAIARIRVAFYEMTCGSGPSQRPPSFSSINAGCRGTLTASPKDSNDDDVPASIHGPEIAWEIEDGGGFIVRVEDYPDAPFNKFVYARGAGGFSICATVQGVRGCMNGRVL